MQRIVAKKGERPNKIVSAALTDLREDGLVPWDNIVDETREVFDYTGSVTVAKDWLAYLHAACLDPWRGQSADHRRRCKAHGHRRARTIRRMPPQRSGLGCRKARGAIWRPAQP